MQNCYVYNNTLYTQFCRYVTVYTDAMQILEYVLEHL